MRRLPPTEIFIVVLTAIFLFVGWRVYGGLHPVSGLGHAQNAPSQLYARLTIRYTKPPIYEEEYDMQDVEGVSKFRYRIRSYNCKQITIQSPTGKVHDVSFFFGGLDQDGIWQMVDLPPLPHPDAYYSVYVKQLADFKEGERTVTFTNPKYWATHSPQRFSLDLSKQGANDLLRLQGQKADPRYQTIVDDFRTFGPDEFRKNVAAAQARARTSACK
ncbi:MAG TPA: hypothetical protein VGF86_05200 [Candidatus Tumulicola sp.]|jgi:hypothetical protein